MRSSSAAIASAAEETDRLAALAEDLLVLARSDEGRCGSSASRFAPASCSTTVAQRFAARADGAGVALEVDASGRARGPRRSARLEQALGNLVDNALRYGAGTIRLEAQAENGSVALRVGDEGEGFAPEFLPHAFERFSRADGARVAGSAGLGLAIVQAIARAHGGTATAANTASGGAVVTLRLPLMALSSGAPTVSPSPKSLILLALAAALALDGVRRLGRRGKQPPSCG